LLLRFFAVKVFGCGHAALGWFAVNNPR